MLFFFIAKSSTAARRLECVSKHREEFVIVLESTALIPIVGYNNICGGLVKLHVVSRRQLNIATKSQNCIINLFPVSRLEKLSEKTTSLVANDQKRRE